MKLNYDNLYINNPADIGVTVDELKEFLRWEASGTSAEAINFESVTLQNAVNSAYYVAERFCNRALAKQSRFYIFNNTIDIENHCKFNIQGGHIQSFIAITIDENDISTVETDKFITTIKSVDDCLFPSIKLKDAECLTESCRELGKLEISVVCGWDILPYDIKTAILQLAAYLYYNRDIWLEGKITDSQVIKSAGAQLLYNYKVYE